MRKNRIAERRHGQRGEQHHECRPQPIAEPAPEQERETEDQRQERDIELALHRHRPDVLQRADRFAGPQVVGDRAGQLPVLVVAEAGQTLVGEGLPPRLRLNQDGQRRACGQHHHQSRQQPPDQPNHLG